MPTFAYFAYGSNMLDERLRHRCPSARCIATGSVAGWRLDFSKRGADGSGKATLGAADACERTHGVLFHIELGGRAALDRAEGPGYRRLDDLIVDVDDAGPPAPEPVTASVYVARPAYIDRSLLAFDWYRDLVLAGALRHHLPSRLVAALRALPVQPDPQPDRPARREALAVLAAAGFDAGGTGRD